MAAATAAHTAFDLKGVSMSLTVLRLKSSNTNLIERQLRAKVTQFPQLFANAPLVLDFAKLDGQTQGMALSSLAQCLRGRGVAPVGVLNLDPGYHAEALAAGLGILAATGQAGASARGEAEVAAPEERPTPVRPRPVAADVGEVPRPPAPVHAVPAPAPVAAPAPSHRPPVVIRQPVRSGQEVYARKTDLIVLAPVNPGADILADGNIHVYATLRGRAVAGASGFEEARIFCQRLEAELVGVAGTYLIHEQIPRDKRGKPVQIYLEGRQCQIALL